MLGWSVTENNSPFEAAFADALTALITTTIRGIIIMNKLGNISFLLALIIALVATAGVSAVNDYMWIMALLGAIFAVMSLSEDNVVEAIVLAIGLQAAATGLNAIPTVGAYIGSFAGHMAGFLMAAALVVALRWLWNTGNVMGLMAKS